MNSRFSGTAVTQAQRDASRPNASVWVGASAGTGKTRVLTDRVLRLLLAGTAPGKILCLTFTKAAAAEMAARLNRRLSDWAVMEDGQLAEDLAILTGHAPDAEARNAARRLFAEVIEAPVGLRFDTLHAFCQSILKRFPLEAGIAPHFEVMDERTASELAHEAREALLVAAQKDDAALAGDLAVLTEYLHEDRFDALLHALVAERARFDRLCRTQGGVEGLVERVHARLGTRPGRTRGALIAAAARDEAFDGTALRSAASVLADGSKTDRARGAAIASWLDAGDARPARFDDYRSAFLTAEGLPRSRLATKAIADRAPEAVETLHAEALRLAALDRDCRQQDAATATSALVRLGADMIRRYAEVKRARAVMDYDDLVLATRQLLAAEDSISWVMFKLDEGLDHILIDEAQDTNPEQWDIVRALAADFFAGAARAEPAAPRTVFAVGDVKQSIFSFQRADPAGFEQARSDFAAAVTASGGGWHSVALDMSFRSTPAILEAVDSVFAGDAAADGVVEKGAALRHVAHRTGQAGLVELWPAPAPPEPDRPERWPLPVAVREAFDPADQLAQLIAARIADWLVRGERLEARGRPVRPGDIMILVRRRGPFVSKVVRALKQKQVPVAGVDRLVLTDHLAVKDLRALGDFLLLPEDDLNLAALLKGPIVDLGEDELFELAWRRKPSLWAALNARRDERGSFAAAHGTLSELLARADFVPPYELFADLLGPRGGREALLRRLGPEAGDPIEEFLNLALDYERSHPASLQGFLAWLGRGETVVKRDLERGERDQVHVMTVHGAKGLEAPIVFLPDTLQVPTDQGARLYWDDELVLWPPGTVHEDDIAGPLHTAAVRRMEAEYRRLLYVAMTRAEDRLYVCGWHTRRRPTGGNWYELIAAGLTGIAQPFAFDAGRWIDHGWTGTGLRLVSPQVAPVAESEAAVRAGEIEPLPDFVRHSPAPDPVPPRPLVPSRPESEEPTVASPLAEDGGASYRRGRLIHRLLQYLPDVGAARRREVADAWLARAATDLDPATREALAAEVLAVIDDPENAPLFGPGSRAEVPVAGVAGTRVVAGQVDRLVVTADAVRIIDYKTNRPSPQGLEDVDPAYLRQMAAYRAVLRDVYADRPTRCALLWTEGPRLMTLPDEVLDLYAP